MSDLVISTIAGLYCPAGDFHIDPWGAVPRAVITHAHADHARPGSNRYLCAAAGAEVLRTRLGSASHIDTAAYGERLRLGDAAVSLHPAGHILGSAQVRIENQNEVWVVSGDYKRASDRTTEPFEPLECDTFVTESTFGLPIYRWPEQQIVFDEVNAWWRENADEKRISVVYAYALGKAQRLLSGLDPSIGPIACHGAVERMNAVYRASGVQLPVTIYAGQVKRPDDWQRALVVAPPSARGTSWLRRFGDFASAFASGWMQIRGIRRRRSVDRGFVLSDHADWPGLIETIEATRAGRVMVTHGMTGPMVRWLNERGLRAEAIATQFEGEQDESATPEVDEVAELDALRTDERENPP